MVKQPSGSVPIATSVLRQAYGHVNRGTTLAVQGVAAEDALPVVEAAVRHWHEHIDELMAEEGLPAFGRAWEGRLRSMIVPDSPDGVAVAVVGTDGRRIDGHAFLAPWFITRSVATTVGRHLLDAGLVDAKIVKPKTRNPPGRISDAANRVTLVAVLTRVEALDDAAERRRSVLDLLQPWVCGDSPTTNAQLGHCPIAGPTEAITRLCDAVSDVDGSIEFATGTNATTVRGLYLHHRVLHVGAAGKRLSPEARAETSRELRDLAVSLASHLDYACVAFGWPVGGIGHGLLPSDGSNGTMVADALVGDAFWFQVLTDQHLERATLAGGEARALGGGRHALEVGAPEDWMAPDSMPGVRDRGRSLLGPARASTEEASDLRRARQREVTRSVPLDPRPEWAGELPVPRGCTKVLGHLSLDWHGQWTYRERWESRRGAITAEQKAPTRNSPSPGNRWIELGRLRVQVVPSSHRTRCVKWWTNGRELFVASDDGGQRAFERLVLALHDDVQARSLPS